MRSLLTKFTFEPVLQSAIIITTKNRAKRVYLQLQKLAENENILGNLGEKSRIKP